jgi:DNA replication and repair protein RecF
LNENLVTEGAFLIHARLLYLKKIAQPILDFLSNIASSQMPVNLGYLSKVFGGLYSSETLYFTGQFDMPSIQILMENLHQKLAQASAQERARRTSVIGPHRDDMVFRVGNTTMPDLLNVGSQGEIRSLLLALKLSELEEFRKHTQIQPVMLIDDFSSELDSTRRGFLLNYLKDSDLQIFVTSTDLFTEGKTIEMVHGKMI